jgi:hypothetical protein
MLTYAFSFLFGEKKVDGIQMLDLETYAWTCIPLSTTKFPKLIKIINDISFTLSIISEQQQQQQQHQELCQNTICSNRHGKLRARNIFCASIVLNPTELYNKEHDMYLCRHGTLSIVRNYIFEQIGQFTNRDKIPLYLFNPAWKELALLENEQLAVLSCVTHLKQWSMMMEETHHHQEPESTTRTTTAPSSSSSSLSSCKNKQYHTLQNSYVLVVLEKIVAKQNLVYLREYKT